jgi:hypothetical protein
MIPHLRCRRTLKSPEEQEKMTNQSAPQQLAAWRHAKAELQVSLKHIKGTIRINCEERATNMPAFDLKEVTWKIESKK